MIGCGGTQRRHLAHSPSLGGRRLDRAEAPDVTAPPRVAAPDRYDAMPYRRVGASGLRLPAISLGLWQNFGDDRALTTQRAIVGRAFDRGVTHFDLANNYGPPYGSAEVNFGRLLASDLRSYRDELIISTKAGYDMWPGPYGDGGSRKYLLASLDQSLGRLGLEYVDIFYSHRVDPETPLEETMGALDAAVRQGKALYVGISSYSAQRTREAAAILRGLGTPLVIHQPSYSMVNRWIEPELLDVLAEERIGAIAFWNCEQFTQAATRIVDRRCRMSFFTLRFDGGRFGGLFHCGLFFIHRRIILRLAISCIPLACKPPSGCRLVMKYRAPAG